MLFGIFDRAIRHEYSGLMQFASADNYEKSDQVRLMARIYERASLVEVSIGEETRHSALGMEILSFLTSNFSFEFGTPWTRNDPKLVRAALDDILSRDYFNRLCVVQEAALSRRARLFAGSASMIWTAGSSAFRFLKRMKFAAITLEWEKAGLSDVDLAPLEDVLELEVWNADKQGTGPNRMLSMLLIQCVIGNV